MCQVWKKVRSEPCGNAGFLLVTHVFPRSRLYSMRDPPQVELIAANIDWSRGSKDAWWIGAGAPCGPSTVHFFRSFDRIVYRPFLVPTRSIADFAIASSFIYPPESAGMTCTVSPSFKVASSQPR